MQEFLLAAFIVNLGLALGAGLYETRIVLSLWFQKLDSKNYVIDTQAMRNIDTGRRFWGFVTTLPLTLLTITNLVLALRSTQPPAGLWLFTSLLILLERLVTFTFFIPAAISFQKQGANPGPKTAAKVSLWVRLNYARNILTFIGLVCSIRVLMLLRPL